jgi:hypothetical protein
MSNSISKLRNIFLQFNTKRIIRYNNKNTEPMNIGRSNDMDNIDQLIWSNYWSNWNLIRDTIIRTKNTFEIQLSYIIPKTITIHNYKTIKSHLRQFIKTLRFIYNTEAQKVKLEQIQQFILQRNNNLKYNQTKMINSILNRKPKKIILNRLHYLDTKTNELIFTTDQKEIEIETINHFKFLGKQSDKPITIFNMLDDIPEEWHPFYDKSNMKPIEEIFKLGEDISLMELELIIKDLPNDKAPGPSKIVYEDFKLSGPKYHQALLNLFNNIIKFRTIPLEWKKATIYPIPKPKDWECKLNNTHPITLLETSCKLLVKVITKRLNSILARNDILQWNNRAGIIGESCFQPIHFTQHVIEQCQQQNIPLWIGLQDLSKAYDRVNVSLLRLDFIFLIT